MTPHEGSASLYPAPTPTPTEPGPAPVPTRAAPDPGRTRSCHPWPNSSPHASGATHPSAHSGCTDLGCTDRCRDQVRQADTLLGGGFA